MQERANIQEIQLDAVQTKNEECEYQLEIQAKNFLQLQTNWKFEIEQSHLKLKEFQRQYQNLEISH